MKKLLTVTVALLALASAAFGAEFRRAQPTLDDVFGASCRVSVEGARGSGLFVCYQGQKAYVLTNYHVVQNNATATLDFWTNHVRQSVRGKVVKRFSDRRANLDFAIIEVDADELKKIDPPYIPLAPVDPSSLTGRKIYAAGGPKGWFVQSWRGANESIESGLVLFSPHPVPGQSGSGVCTIIDGQIYAVEVLTYLLGDENSDASKGGALPVLYLANALKGVRQDFGDATLKTRPIPVAVLEDDSEPTATGSELSILAFTTTDCPACRIGEVGLKAYEDAGGVVKRVDPNKSEYSNIAVAFDVKETPTYFVVDSNNDPLLRISYDDIKSQGAVAAIRMAVAKATPKPKVETTPEPKAVEQKSEPKVVDPVSDSIQLDSDHGVVISEAGEPKRTLPVYVTDPKEYELDLRQPVYDDSSSTVAFDLFSNWRNHDADDNGDEQDIPNESTGDQSQKQLGDRIADRLANALAPRIDKSVNAAADAISKRIAESLADENTPLGSMKKDLETRIEKKMRAVARQYAWRVALDLVILMILAQLATQGVIAICKRAFNATVEMRREISRYRDFVEKGNGDGKQ